MIRTRFSYCLSLLLPLILCARVSSAIDAARVVGPEACGNCHRLEYEKWKTTRHYQLLDTLYKNPNAQKIAQAMGERLIKVGSLCLTCHFTPKELNGKLTATAGVSCESCHGPARDWINTHNDFGGKQFNHDNEPPEHKKQRLAQAAAAGMFPPEQIYLLASNCFGCHTVQNEKLVNVGGHPAGSDFDLAERIDVIRHNFVRAGRNVNAPVTPERKRVMYVVGWSLALEYALRGAALATQDGTFVKHKASLARSAMSELRSIKEAVNLPEIDTIVNAAQGLEIKANNSAELKHAADKVRDAGKAFVEKYDGSKLAALDSVMSGGGEEESESAGAPGEASGGQDQTSQKTVPGTKTAGGTGAGGEIKRHIRPPSSHKTIGPNCGCHGDQNKWWSSDKHNSSAQPFWDENPKNVKIARLYGISPSDMKTGKAICMDCHGTVVSGKEGKEVADGVSCENCHGAAADYVKIHNDGKNFKQSEAFAGGMNNLFDVNVRAEKCTGCHYVTEARLISAGHPSNANFDYASAIGKIKHWKKADDTAQFKAAVDAAIAKRGAVPKVQMATMPAGEPEVQKPAGGATSKPAAGGGPVTAGEVKRHIRAPSPHKTLGPSNCGCHKEQNAWWSSDKHNSSAQPFWDDNPKNVQIAQRYGISSTEMKNGQNICMDCHGTVVNGKESREVADGVSCENCHGAGADYLKAHNDGKSFKPNEAYAAGMNKLQDYSVRAEKCTGCHYITEAKLIAAGHPTNANFDYAAAVGKIKHWKQADDIAQFKAAVVAAIGKRGPIPKVEMVGGPAGGGAPQSGGGSSESAAGRPTTASRPNPLAPRPASPNGPPPADAKPIELPPFPEINDSTSLDQVLSVLQKRLELLHAKTGAAHD